MGSECTICINFSKNFPGGGPPEPPPTGWGYPPPASSPCGASRGYVYAPGSGLSVSATVLWNHRAIGFHKHVLFKFLPFWCFNSDSGFGEPPPPPNPHLRDGGIPLPHHHPPAALRADLFTPPAVDPLDPPLFFEITGPSVFTNTSCLSFFCRFGASIVTVVSIQRMDYLSN